MAAADFAGHLGAEAGRQGLREWRGGVVRISGPCRAALRDSICISADPALQPKLRVHMQCSERHPGLCKTIDSAFFASAFNLAKVIHQKVFALEIGVVVAFETNHFMRLLAVASKRFRDPEIAIFAECVFAGLKSDEIQLLSRKGELVFHTSFGLARSLTACSKETGHDIVMTRFDVGHDPATPLTVRLLSRDAEVLLSTRNCAVGSKDSGGGGDDEPRRTDLLDIIAAAGRRPPARRGAPGVAMAADLLTGVATVAAEDCGDCASVASRASGESLDDELFEDDDDTEDDIVKKPTQQAKSESSKAPPQLQAEQVVQASSKDPPGAASNPASSGGAGGAAVREARASKDGWPRLWLPSGLAYVRLSLGAGMVWDMRACCEHCKATLSRTCKGPGPRARPGTKACGQGRPLGKLWAWAKHAEALGDHTSSDHQAYSPGFEARCAARSEAVGQPGVQQWLDHERPAVAGTDCMTAHGEPLDLP